MPKFWEQIAFSSRDHPWKTLTEQILHTMLEQSFNVYRIVVRNVLPIGSAQHCLNNRGDRVPSSRQKQQWISRARYRMYRSRLLHCDSSLLLARSSRVRAGNVRNVRGFESIYLQGHSTQSRRSLTTSKSGVDGDSSFPVPLASRGKHLSGGRSLRRNVMQTRRGRMSQKGPGSSTYDSTRC